MTSEKDNSEELHEIENITETDKTLAELNKAFLVARAEQLNSQSIELLKASVVFAKDAIRLLFFMHGACATAIVALGKIDEYRHLLFLLGVGAFLSVTASGFAYIAQRLYAECFQIYTDAVFLKTYESHCRFLRPDISTRTYRKDIDSWRRPSANIATLCACTAWISSLFVFVSVANIFHNM